VDLCLIGDDLENGDIEPIEWNPFQPGQLGLFGCDPRAIATGVRAHLEMYPDSYRVGHVDRESLAQDLDGAPLENPQTSDMDWMEFDG
jgi:hypothetical protein